MAATQRARPGTVGEMRAGGGAGAGAGRLGRLARVGRKEGDDPNLEKKSFSFLFSNKQPYFFHFEQLKCIFLNWSKNKSCLEF
jgi:hypothetical protein